jgi:hypothetical protein
VAEQPPPDFDWVTATARWSPGEAFMRLRSMAKANVDARNAAGATGTDGASRFGFHEHGPMNFAVTDRWVKQERRAVDFKLEGDAIVIATDDEHAPIKAHPVLTRDGQSNFRIEDETRSRAPWQLLRLALKDLFFQD